MPGYNDNYNNNYGRPYPNQGQGRPDGSYGQNGGNRPGGGYGPGGGNRPNNYGPGGGNRPNNYGPNRGYGPNNQYGPNNNRKKGGAGNIISTILLVLAIGVFFFAGFKLYGYYKEYKAGSDEYNDLANQYIMKPPADPSTPQTQTQQKTVLTDYHLLEDPKTVESVKAGAATKKVVENGTEKELPLLVNPVDFTQLQGINPEVMGWLNVNALKINYPVAQRDGDNEYYLHHTFRGEEVFSGCIFLNCDNSKYMTDQNSIIYGHNMKDGSMFGTLRNMQEQAKYDSNPYFWVFTPDLIYQYRIFACSVVSNSGDPYRTRFANDEFKTFINNSVAGSYISNGGVQVTEKDRIVTLSTCTGDDSTRFIVQGVLEQVYASASAGAATTTTTTTTTTP